MPPDGQHGLRVLVVEDHADGADRLAILQRLVDHEVEVARDVPAAPEAAPRYGPDVVLLDPGLPEGTLEPSRLAVLADALEDAGCGDAELLGHLRGPGPHVRGCCAVDLQLAKQ